MTIRAALYPRISSDKRDDEAGVERQAADGRALAAALGWAVVGEFPDNDLSATKGSPRPGYEALMASVARGEIDQIIVWQTSRLWRNRRERADGIGFLAQHQVGIKAVKGPDLDLSTAYGRGMAGLLGEFDTMESEVKSERVLRALEQNGTEGRPHGRPAYGWIRGHDEHRRPVDVVNPIEAAVVREIAARVLAGESLASITADLNAREIPSPMARPWGKNMVRHLVLRERNAGLRRHKGEVVGQGTWDPILDAGIWEQVRAILADPARRTSAGSTAAHLLSGIARCGKCGGTIRAGSSGHKPVVVYRCQDHSCVLRNRDDVDAWVVANVLDHLRRFDPAAFALDQPAARGAADEAAALRARMDLAADAYAEGTIDARQLERITAKIRPQIIAADARARTVDAAPLLEGLVGAGDPTARWADLPLSRRRGVVAFMVDVRILPLNRARKGAHAFDPKGVPVTLRRVT